MSPNPSRKLPESHVVRIILQRSGCGGRMTFDRLTDRLALQSVSLSVSGPEITRVFNAVGNDILLFPLLGKAQRRDRDGNWDWAPGLYERLFPAICRLFRAHVNRLRCFAADIEDAASSRVPHRHCEARRAVAIQKQGGRA